jgi:hypothetical protein
MSTTEQYNDWGAKIIAWTESEEGERGNKKITAFCNATDPDALNQADRVKAITSTPEVIALAVTEESKIVVLHSIKNFGGSLTRSQAQDKILALSGVSHDAKAVELIVESALKDYKSKAPKFEDLKDKSVDELKEVPALLRVTRDCAHLSRIVVPPPFLTNTIVKAAMESEEGES